MVERFLFEQFLRELVENSAVGREHRPRLVTGIVNQRTNLGVNPFGDAVAVIALVSDVTTQEHLAGSRTQLHRPNHVRHSKLGDHAAGDSRRFFDVIRGARCRVLENDFFRNPTAHGVRQLVEQFVASDRILVVKGHNHRVTEGSPTGKNRDFCHGIGLTHRCRRQSVTSLVIGGDEPFFVFHDPRPLLRSGHDAVDGLVEGLVRQFALALPSREKRRFVDDVGEVGTGVSGRLAREHLEVDVLRHWLVFRMHRENLGAALRIGGVHLNLAIESAGTQKRRVKDVGAVGRGDHDDVLSWLEAVHLDEELVQGLFALVVATTHSRTTVTPDGVDLVNKDNGGRVLFRDVEEVTNTARADTDEHFDEVRTGNRIERNRCLASNGTCEQSLTRSRRAVQQHSLGDTGSDLFEFFGVLQEFFDLVKFFDRFVRAGDILERHLRGFLVEQLGAGTAELHGSASTARIRRDEPERETDDEERDDEPENRHEP